MQPGSPEHKLGVAWETSLDALLVVDDERRCVCINQPAISLLGAPVEEVLNRRLEDFIPQEHRADLERLWAAWEDQGCQLGACQVLRGDGSRSTVEYRATWDYGPGQHLIAARPVGARRAGTGPRAGPTAPALTRREREVLQLAADGRSVAEIAERLFLSPGTVRTHLQNIHKKLGVRDRASAVAAGLRTGLIE